MLAEVVVPAVEGDDGLSGRLVEPVGGGAGFHGRASLVLEIR